MFDLLKRNLGPRVCSWVPLDLWHSLLNVKLVIPHWHIVSDNNVKHVSGIYDYRSLRQFKADLEFFLRFYKPISLQDVIRHLEGGRRLPKRGFLPTFDDGFREIYDVVAPILLSKGVPAVFFLITSAIDNHELCYPQKKSLLIHALRSQGDPNVKREVSRLLTEAGVNGSDLPSRIRSIYYRKRQVLDDIGCVLRCHFAAYVDSVQPYLTSDQIRDLIEKGFDIGAHSIDHPLYSELNLVEQLIQTRESMRWISDNYQYECQAFAFPYRDAGISSEFFKKAFSDERLKVSFGIGGLLNHFFPRNLPRFSMERTDRPASQILSRQFGKALLERLSYKRRKK